MGYNKRSSTNHKCAEGMLLTFQGKVRVAHTRHACHSKRQDCGGKKWGNVQLPNSCQKWVVLRFGVIFGANHTGGQQHITSCSFRLGAVITTH